MERKTVVMITMTGILIVSFVGMGFLASLKKNPPVRPAEEVKRAVRVAQIQYSDIQSPVIALGRVVSEQEVTLSSEVRGQILQGDVPLKKGQSFKKGDVLIKIYDKETRLGLLAAKSRFLKNIATLLPDYKVDYPASFDRWKNFFDSIDIKKPLPELPAIKSDKEKIFLASRNILSEYYSIKQSEELLNKYEIEAPFNGSFTNVNFEVGAIANPGSMLANIIQTDSLEVEIPVEVDDARWINNGESVKLTTEDGDIQWQGVVVRKSDFVDPQTQSIATFVKVKNNKSQTLYKGQYVKAIFAGADLKSVMEIPRNAVFNHNEVFVVNDERLKKEEIEIVKINQRTIIFRGIDAGNYVVSEPLVNAVENTLVEMIE